MIYSINDIQNGTVEIKSERATGTFASIREMASSKLEAGQAMLMADLVKDVKATFDFDTRKANMYVRNAIKDNAELNVYRFKMNGRVFIGRN